VGIFKINVTLYP